MTDCSQDGLDGLQAEFCDALAAEITASRRRGAASATPLRNGRRLGHTYEGWRYTFTSRSELRAAGDTPAELLLPGRAPVAVTVIEVGERVVLTCEHDLGATIPEAGLHIDLSLLLQRLIDRIVAHADEDNDPGDRLLGRSPSRGAPVAVAPLGLNPEQTAAVGAVLGRNTCVIWGPPGTGKTQTIGAIGAELARRGESVLVVSHTNAAVDHALLRIATAVTATDPDALRNGEVLRVGVSADPRVNDRPDLLLSTHVRRRSRRLTDQLESLRSQRADVDAEIVALGMTVERYRWAADIEPRLHEWTQQLTDLQHEEAGVDTVDPATRRAAVHRAARRRRQLTAALAEWRDSVTAVGTPLPRADDAEAALTALHDTRRAIASEMAINPPIDVERAIAIHERTLQDLDRRIDETTAALSEVEKTLIDGASVVGATLTASYLRSSIQDRRFDTVILDEASMAPIPALWFVARLATRCVVAVGDFLQLPPIVISEAPVAKEWLGTDIFEHLGINSATNTDPIRVDLLRQYRMHPSICELPNRLLYGGRLVSETTETDPADLFHWWTDELLGTGPIHLVDLSDEATWVTGVERGGAKSRFNLLSAALSVTAIQRMLRPDRPPHQPGTDPRVLVVSPYRPHADLLTSMLRSIGLHGEVRAGTAHAFQGAEADVVVLDLVNAPPHWKVAPFQRNRDGSTRRLLNVAVTRARRRLIVLCDLDWTRAKGPQAFLVRDLLPALTGEHPIVAGHLLAARTASESPGEPLSVLDAAHAVHDLHAEVANASERVVVASPSLRGGGFEPLLGALRVASDRGCDTAVLTTAPHRSRGAGPAQRDLERRLADAGCTVVHKKDMREEVVLVDDVLWACSGPVAEPRQCAWVVRVSDPGVVDAYVTTTGLSFIADGLGDGTTVCPICGRDVELAEGDAGPFWRCPGERCFRMNLDRAHFRDGRVTCPTCDGDVAFGTWGDHRVWRCTTNPRHHHRVTAEHLRYPAMRALVPADERDSLAVELGVRAPDAPTLFDGW